jgi:hypothetical protein
LIEKRGAFPLLRQNSDMNFSRPAKDLPTTIRSILSSEAARRARDLEQFLESDEAAIGLDTTFFISAIRLLPQVNAWRAFCDLSRERRGAGTGRPSFFDLDRKERLQGGQHETIHDYRMCVFDCRNVDIVRANLFNMEWWSG